MSSYSPMTKRTIIGPLFTFGLLAAVFLVSGSQTYAAPPKTIFDGTVKMSGSPVSAANVVVTCSHGAVSHNASTNTNASGKYHLEFPIPNCTPNSHVVVSATKGTFTGTTTGSAGNPNQVTVLDVSIQAAAVPEFGMISGVVAMIASAGFALRMRRSTV